MITFELHLVRDLNLLYVLLYITCLCTVHHPLVNFSRSTCSVEIRRLSPIYHLLIQVLLVDCKYHISLYVPRHWLLLPLLYTLGKLATHDVLKTTHLTKTAHIFIFSLPCNSVLSTGAYFASLLPCCDITAHTVLLYVVLCLTYMYCTLYVLYILHTVRIVHVPCFPVSDVEVSPSTSVHAHLFTYILEVFTYI